MSQEPKRAQPEALRARAIALSLTVQDLDRSLAWYTQGLGFHVDRRFERDGKPGGAALIAGEVRINLNLDDGKKGSGRVKGQGMSIHIHTAQNVDGIAERLTSYGGKLEEGPSDKPWGVRSFTTLDPDGFKVSVARPLAES